jgi:hypothetical protein
VNGKLFRLVSDSGASLPEEAFSRIHRDELWRDLWTDFNAYNEAFKRENSSFTIDFFDTGDFDDHFDFKLSNLPIFLGWFDLLPSTSIPSNDLRWTILSREIIEVFNQLGFTDYVRVPLTVVDRNAQPAFPISSFELEHFRVNSNAFVSHDWFSEVQVHSRFNVLADATDAMSSPAKIVVREDIEISEVPLVFRDPKLISNLIIRAEVRDALLDSGIQGLRFMEPFGV